MIVADTSPLSAFLRIRRADLLSALFPRIVIPGAVASELDRGPSIVGTWRTAMGFVEPRTIEPTPLLGLLQADLDPGEAEAIALAVQEKATLLIDEARGRALARRLAVNVIGSVGVCVLAKEQGLVATVRPLIEDLRVRGGLWLSDALLRDVLTRSGE